MKNKILIVIIVLSFSIASSLPVFAERRSSDLLRQGLLGAGAGAVGGAASGAKGRDVWKGALAGAGVNILGGMLLDSISGEKVRSESHVKEKGSTDAYGMGYQDGFNNGFKSGYMSGFKDGVREDVR